ncbi:MAG: hypothetical protein ACFWTL_09945 [Atopobium sp.]
MGILCYCGCKIDGCLGTAYGTDSRCILARHPVRERLAHLFRRESPGYARAGIYENLLLQICYKWCLSEDARYKAEVLVISRYVSRPR